MIPRVLKVGYKQLFPGTVVPDGPKNAELFRRPVLGFCILGVPETHTKNCRAAAKVQDEPLFFARLAIFSEPVVGRIQVAHPVNVQSQDVAGQMILAVGAVTSLRPPWTSVACAADYLNPAS